ncbi:MAG: chemotaxis protein CheA, partial [Proteobacteria bacterium]|nr:chemotaxis protein CheA [Pseudomonadota bacterium]
PFKPFFSSLVHLIRNSVDHGLETTDIRSMLGKPDDGVLKIGAAQDKGRFIVTISDDGRGIDQEVIRNKALEKGLITSQQADAMSEKEVVKLIFESGFSTSEAVTDLSGRGVGMDAVASAVEALEGEIDVSTETDGGTTFTISLPTA